MRFIKSVCFETDRSLEKSTDFLTLRRGFAPMAPARNRPSQNMDNPREITDYRSINQISKYR